jgi:peptide deformylase
MATLEILQYPDSRLRHVAAPVETVDAAVCQLADDLVETMKAAPGIGLAATQVGVDRRVCVVDVSDDTESPWVLINPEITWRQGSTTTEEGCLSIPDVYDKVPRAERIGFRALDRNGEAFAAEGEGMLAICVQHELDHLDGRLFIDHLSLLKRQRIDKRIAKQRRREGGGPSRAAG